MDEVLLSSVVEACVRIGHPELLTEKLQQIQSGGSKVDVSGAHTFGSLIKAYGCARDMAGVWRTWKEMRTRRVKPTSVTLGCMVEAVAANGDTDRAHELIHEMLADDQCRGEVNAVLYCSILKGFAREKKMGRVMKAYEEMRERRIDLSIVTYNTTLDACARCQRMDLAPRILRDMKEQGIALNLISYSTLLKGHCQAGNVREGFNILSDMRQSTTLRPDEIMYNSLLDGCAQHNMVEDGLQLLGDMQADGVKPSNFTLSIVVKILGYKAKKLDEAFKACEVIQEKYHIPKLNIHVYTNLIQACVYCRDLPRALRTMEELVQKARIRPELRTYNVLVRGLLSGGRFGDATAVLRSGLGLPHGIDFLERMQPKTLVVCGQLGMETVGEVVGALIERGGEDEKQAATGLVNDIRKLRRDLRIDSKTLQTVLRGR